MKLNFPEYAFRIGGEEDKYTIFDELRKKWVALTEEEWVRQHAIQYLLQDKLYPASLIAIEREFVFNGLKKRFDLLVFTNEAKPFLLLECKAPRVSLTENALMQICTYNQVYDVPYLWVTNGLVQQIYTKNELGFFEPIKEIPVYKP